MKTPSKLVLVCGLLGSLTSISSHACSSDAYLGSICVVAFTFCPRGYEEASGQLVSIAQNTALFSLLGTTYGGDGRTTFALPDLRSRVPRGVGQGPGLSQVVQGQVDGVESVTINNTQMPAHSHSAQLRGSSAAGNVDSPSGSVPAKMARSNNYSNGAADSNMGSSALIVGSAGLGQPLSVLNPSLGMRYCIATAGVYPSRP